MILQKQLDIQNEEGHQLGSTYSNSGSVALFSPLVDLDLDQTLTQTAVISRVQLPDITDKSCNGDTIRQRTELLRLKSFLCSSVV